MKIVALKNIYSSRTHRTASAIILVCLIGFSASLAAVDGVIASRVNRVFRTARMRVGLLAPSSAITVNTIGQSIQVGGGCTLPDAIRAANMDMSVGGCPAGSSADTIILPPGTYTITTVNNVDRDGFGTGLPVITSFITIEGAGPDSTVIERSDAEATPDFRLFYVASGGNLTLSGVTVRNGRSGGGGAILNRDAPVNTKNCVFSNNTSNYPVGGGAIHARGDLRVTNSTFTGNTSIGGGGGAIISYEKLTVTDSVFTGNTATGFGGALEISGHDNSISGSFISTNLSERGGGIYSGSGRRLTLANSTIAGNHAINEGGGLHVGALVMVNSTVSNNSAEGSGGGIGIPLNGTDRADITGSTVSGNTAESGGGISGNTVTLNNTTISGNLARQWGGGISSSGGGSITANNSTVTNNTADSDGNGTGGGGGVRVDSANPTLNIRNTIIAGNHHRASPDCSERFDRTFTGSQGYNIIGNNAGCNFIAAASDQIGTSSSLINPELAPLANNGGSTQTHALLPGSPAIDAANPAAPGADPNACAATDQRGAARPTDGDLDGTPRCDIGSYEVLPLSAVMGDVAVAINDSSDPVSAGAPLTYNITVTNRGPFTATGVNVADTLAPGLEFVSATLSQGVYTRPGGDRLIFYLGTLNNRAVATITLVVRPTFEGVFVNTATVSAAETDTDAANNSATATTNVLPNGTLTISSITPNRGGNVGPLAVRVDGTAIDADAAVRLTRQGQPDIIAGMVNTEASGLGFGAIFDLNGAAVGAWDLVVTNPDGMSTMQSGAFMVEAGRAPHIWVEILGRGGIRTGREETFNIVYGNDGNVDAFGVIIEMSFTKGVLWRPGFPVHDPPPVEGLDYSQVPDHLETADRVVLPIFIPAVPAGSSRSLPIFLTLPPRLSLRNDEIEIEAYADPPLLVYEPGTTESAQATKNSFRLARTTNPGCGGGGFGGSDAQECLINAGGAVLDCVGLFPSAPGCLASLVSSIAQYAGNLCQLSNKPFEKGAHAVFLTKLLTAAFVNVFDCFGVKNKFLDAAKIADCLNSLKSAYDSCVKWLSPPGRKKIRRVDSFDPNDKSGAEGTGDGRFISGKQPLPYLIQFENLETASAPAQTVVVTDHLDPAMLDFSTFNFGPVTFGAMRVEPPAGVTDFVSDVDLRPDKDLILRVEGHLDTTTGLLTWSLTSLDPDTGVLTADPFAGFLPPNQMPPEGEGSVMFFVTPRQGLPDGTGIRNKARIVFDTNEPIDTAEWLNTLDAAAPTSHVLPLAVRQNSGDFEVMWTADDEGSGVHDYTIYVSEDGGPFYAWLSNTVATSAIFHGSPGVVYGFFSLARDNTGNSETAKSSAEVITKVNRVPVLINPDAQTSAEGALVSFQLSASEPDGDAVTYGATGLPAGLSIDAVSGLITGALDFNSAATYVVTASISDNYGGSASASFTWTVQNVNRAPSAYDSGPTTVEDTSLAVQLLAEDPDADPIIFTIKGGPAHGTLSGTGGNLLYKPDANFSGMDSFTYQASDAFLESNIAIITINVQPINDSPVLASIGDQTVAAGSLLSFELSASDPDEDPLTLSIRDLPGGAIFNAATGTFSWMPTNGEAGAHWVTFSVTDPSGASASETIKITVSSVIVNRGPDCSAAAPSITEIWPPNHEDVLWVDILDIIDPDQDPISITIRRVLQDEPTNTLGDGTTWIDGGGLGSGRAWLRAERSGTPRVPGNGRVYEIFFEASDGRGKTCTGSVKVGVPRDHTKGSAIDDGKRYDSTVANGPCLNCQY